jgi:hypothetical protein
MQVTLNRRSRALQFAAAMIPIVAFSAAALPSANAVAQTPSVWVLHDGDPNYTNPTVGDTLTGLFADGQVGAAVTGLNIDQTVGGQHAITVAPFDRSVIVAEDVGGFVRKYDAHGTLL